MIKPDTTHSEYAAAQARWMACRDVIDGEDAVHKGGDRYLPKLTDQTTSDYKAYVMRAPFYNATSRTIDGLVGLLFRKDPMLTVPAAMQPIIDDMTLTNADFMEVAEVVTREVIGMGRVGALVEYPQVVEGPLTQAQAQSQNLRPYVSIYKTESIINWRVERVNNVSQPVMVTLMESVSEWSSEFECSQIAQIRALMLFEGRYFQRLYRKNARQEWEQHGEDIYPLMRGRPLDYIPMVIFGPAHNDVAVQKPPVYDLVTLNLSHYRTTADLEHGAHFTGLPTAVVTGYSPADTEKLAIGSSNAWIFPEPAAKASYLEFTGQGLQALETRLKEKEAGMAAIGARMLAPEKNVAEASRTVRLRHSGEGAVLAAIGDMVEHGFDRVLQICADWEGLTGEVKTEFNDDFEDTVMLAQDITALVGAWQAGAISFDTLFWNLKQGEMVEGEKTAQMEKEEIDAAGPPLGAMPAVKPGGIPELP